MKQWYEVTVVLKTENAEAGKYPSTENLYSQNFNVVDVSALATYLNAPKT